MPYYQSNKRFGQPQQRRTQLGAAQFPQDAIGDTPQLLNQMGQSSQIGQAQRLASVPAPERLTPSPTTFPYRLTYGNQSDGGRYIGLGLQSVRPGVVPGATHLSELAKLEKMRTAEGQGQYKDSIVQEALKNRRPGSPNYSPNGYTSGFGNRPPVQTSGRLAQALGRQGLTPQQAGFAGPSAGPRLLHQPDEQPRAFNPQQALAMNGGSSYEPGTLPGGSTFSVDDSGRATVRGNIDERRLRTLGVTRTPELVSFGMPSGEIKRDNSRQMGRYAANSLRRRNRSLAQQLGQASEVPTDPVMPGADPADIQASLETQRQLAAMLGDDMQAQRRGGRLSQALEQPSSPADSNPGLTAYQQSLAANRSALSSGAMQLPEWREQALMDARMRDPNFQAPPGVEQSGQQQNDLQLAQSLVTGMTPTQAEEALVEQRFPQAVIDQVLAGMSESMTPRQREESRQSLEGQREQRERRQQVAEEERRRERRYQEWVNNPNRGPMAPLDTLSDFNRQYEMGQYGL